MTDETIFATALEKGSEAERRAYLDEACAGQPELRARVEALLKASTDAGSFFEHPPAALEATMSAATADGTPQSGTARPVALPDLEPCDKPDRIGRLGPYEIIEVVGQGGFGLVLRAFDTKLHRIVAIKVLSRELAENAMAVQRFLREAQRTAAVVHDHVVTIHGVEPSATPPYLVMQFIEGQSLQQKLDRMGALRLVEILRIGMQTAQGLAAAHRQGLIHRDVKPANILLENGVERVKITDFGLARAADDVNITRSGQIAGTPQYMSPEQAQGQPVDARSDLFSLGGVLYAMCTGRPPFRADSAIAVLRRVCDDTPRPIAEVNPEIPEWLDEIVMKLLAKKPEDRFPSAAEVADLLAQHLAHVQQPQITPRPAPVSAPRPAMPQKAAAQSKSPLRVLLIVLLLAAMIPMALAVVAVFMYWAMPSGAFSSPGKTTIEFRADEQGAKLSVLKNGVLEQATGGGGLLELAPGSYELRVEIPGEPAPATVLLEQERADGGRFDARVPNPAYLRIERGNRVTVKAYAGNSMGALETAPADRLKFAWGDVIDPDGDCRVVEFPPDKLAITIPGSHHDLNPTWPGPKKWNAPRVLRNVAGDFTAQVEVLPFPPPKAGISTHGGSGYCGAGLVVWIDERNFLRFFRARFDEDSGDKPFLNVDSYRNGTIHVQRADYVEDEPTFLQIERISDTLVLRYSADGRGWIDLVEVAGLPLRDTMPVGVAAINSVKEERRFEFRGLTIGSGESLSSGAMLDLADDWTPLFDGRDLSGWKLHPREPGRWRVVDGVLIGDHGPSHLFSERDDFGDFHLRLEGRLSADGNSGLLLAREFGFSFDLKQLGGEGRLPEGIEIDLHAGIQPEPAGTIWQLLPSPSTQKASSQRVRPNEWFTLEVRKSGRDLQVSIDGVAVSTAKNLPPAVQPCRLALQNLYGFGQVAFRKIEIREPRRKAGTRPPPAVAPFDTAAAIQRQENWAKHLGAPVEITNAQGMTFRLIPPGEFVMGSSTDEQQAALAMMERNLRIQHSDDERQQQAYMEYLRPLVAAEGPPHAVTLTKPFYLGTTEVTQAQFAAFVSATGHVTSAEKVGGRGGVRFDEKGRVDTSQKWNWKNPGLKEYTPEHPVAQVSWNDAIAFCEWLGKEDGVAYRLPTEAEWEFACRAGTTTPWSSGSDPAALEQSAWGLFHPPLSAEDFDLHPVAKKRANPFGLFDLHGNNQEWCSDWFSKVGYSPESQTDPAGPAGPDGDKARVIRGGALFWAHDLRSAIRRRAEPDYADNGVGFRVVRAATPAPRKQPPLAVAPFTAELARSLQEQWAGHEGVPVQFRNSLGMTLRLIPPGEFQMGCSPVESAEAKNATKLAGFDTQWIDFTEASTQPQHRVQITKPWYFGVHEVTVGQFKKFVDESGYKTVAEREPPKGADPNEPAWRRYRDNQPVFYVAWQDATEFCNWLSAREGKSYRLPTEAQWEFACRAGTTGKFSCGNDAASLAECAWFGKERKLGPDDVGRRRANPFGLHDMHGNVFEWCVDWHKLDFYGRSPVDDPVNLDRDDAQGRVLRGGGYAEPADLVRSAARSYQAPESTLFPNGFRVAVIGDLSGSK